MTDVACLGQFTADVVTKPVESLPDEAVLVDEISLHNGGCACNAAVALGRLGIGTAALGKVGRDAFGDFVLRRLTEAGVDTRGIVRDGAVSTSATVVLVDGQGERSFLHYYGANAAMSEEDVNYDLLRRCTVLHVAAAFLVPGLDGEPMAHVLSRAQQMQVTTCLDTAWDPEGRWMEVLEPCLPHLDYFVPSREEARVLSGRDDPPEMAAQFLDRGVDTVVIKLGAEGCYARTADAELSVPAFEVESVVDTLGAGDAFVAGFLAGLVQGRGLEKACQLGNAVGACCVRGTGPEGVRSLEETLRLYPIDS